ncbi:MAG: hypothetical protein P794_01740 [Epsilonproteobacteria bacterium (ex Lamellibrachia satsuma)]|nr:MAG: hypothetical protein P794_01740 [Epsilonproteobacteria bacterium (ex Lamellibrachia satsuma)]
MKKLLQLGLIMTGALALTLTLANAKCNNANNEAPIMKCESGKCNTGKCNKGGMGMKKEMNATKPSTEKPAPVKGKCGTGKCG